MTAAQTWTFRQRGGKPPKVFTLEGGFAPHGRARVGAVVNLEQAADATRRYYGGDNVTRHIFGIRYGDWTLKGRFRDRDITGPGSARKKAEELRLFHADRQPVDISWGSILSMRGFVKEVRLGIEAEHEITWEMVVEIDYDDLNQSSYSSPSPPVKELASSAMVQVAILLSDVDQKFPPMTSLGGFVDKIESILTFPGEVVQEYAEEISDKLGLLNRMGDMANKVAGQFQKFEKTTFETATRFIAAFDQIRSAINTFRMTVQQYEDRSARLVDTVQKRIQSFSAMTTVEDLLDEADVLCERAAKAVSSVLSGFHAVKAKPGDTWEALSLAMYGTVTYAGLVRQFAKALPGSAPTPGQVYLGPRDVKASGG